MTDTLEAQVGQLLTEKALTVCTAESCTGGLIASRITDVAGSSSYMAGGVVAYANAAKQNILKVRQGTLIAYGAVSEPTAGEMAAGAKALFGTDIAVSITGIAGPGGGTDEKPVGLTYIGLVTPDDEVVVQRHIWEGDRHAIKQQSSDAALSLILDTLS